MAAVVAFDDVRFEEKNGSIEAVLLGSFSVPVPAEELRQLGSHEVQDGKLIFHDISEKKARNKLSRLLQQHAGQLSSKVTRKPAFYITRESGIPLIGNAAFGIVDRNSNLLEVKPVTGCNMNCIFCSVDEGLATRKVAEIVVEPAYLAEECRAVVEHKGCTCHITINAHGEPLTYGAMPELVGMLRGIDKVKTISLITNGTLLSEQLIDRLAEAGLTTLNISLNAIDERMAKMLEGHGLYDASKVKELARYAAGKLQVIIAPVYVPGFNDAELKKLALFGKEIGAQVSIQNFLHYNRGRNPGESMPMEQFYRKLRELEKETGMQLIVDAKAFGIIPTRPLPKPFRKGNKVKARVACYGRYPGERIVVAGERTITVQRCQARPETAITVSITGDKHNLFYGMEL